jgi:hypothetical protein
MKISPIVLWVFLISCTKNNDAPSGNVQPLASQQKPQTCNFGISVFNKARRAAVHESYTEKKKPRDGGTTATASAAILLDFDGQVVSNTIWNAGNTINAAAANLRSSEMERIVQRVAEDFSPFNVTITTDEAVYNNTDPFKRMRVIVTESWEWFGVVGGTAFDNSFVWGNNTPCFIFSTLLGYNEKFIAEAISHEVGHTLGLRHQALYDEACNFLSEFNLGFGEGTTGWAPIMGIGYYRNVTTWHKGPTVFGCNVIQDDVAVIAGVLGLQPDDNAEMVRSEKFNTSAEGIINSTDDIDYFFLDLKQPATVTVQPHCLENEEGANLKLKMNVDDRHGVLIKAVDTPSTLSVSTLLAKEKYYIGVETKASENQNRYGMLGRYVLLTE